MIKLFIAAVVAIVMSTHTAHAVDHAIFGGTNVSSGTVILTFDGSTPFFAEDTGWLTNRGNHGRSNENYLTGFYSSNGSDEYRSFFTFMIREAAPISPYTSATITFESGFSIGTGPFELSLYDVQAAPLDLDVTRPFDDPMGQSMFQDLGSGTLYGSSSLPGPYMAEDSIEFALNQTFLDRVNSGLLTTFSIGGALSPATAVSAVPEAPTWAMMIVGLGAAGCAMRRRVSASFA